MTTKRRKKNNFIDNKEMYAAFVEYRKKVDEAKANGEPKPLIPRYIGKCFLDIAEHLSMRPNFSNYMYRQDMVMDAVENCLKAIDNYNLEAATRTGKPNAFAYFTQITWYAFLRRIQKEKRQQDIKMKYIAEAGIENFLDLTHDDGNTDYSNVLPFVDILRQRIDVVKSADAEFKEYAKEEKKQRKRRAVNVDSDLTDHFTE